MREQMLSGFDVDLAKEMNHGEEKKMDTGEVTFSLDFDDDVKYDVDAGPDGNIIVQYWRTEE